MGKERHSRRIPKSMEFNPALSKLVQAPRQPASPLAASDAYRPLPGPIDVEDNQPDRQTASINPPQGPPGHPARWFLWLPARIYPGLEGRCLSRSRA
jgi:hypothetical protein